MPGRAQIIQPILGTVVACANRLPALDHSLDLEVLLERLVGHVVARIRGDARGGVDGGEAILGGSGGLG